MRARVQSISADAVPQPPAANAAKRGKPLPPLTRLHLPLPPRREAAAALAAVVVARVAAHALEALLLQRLQPQALALLKLLCGGAGSPGGRW
jgi:hypothetical protein